MTELHFEEPPEAPHPLVRTGQGKHWDAAKQLRERPGEYAMVAAYNSRSAAASTAYMVRQGLFNAYAPRGAFHAVSRTVEGEFRVYVKYVGEQEQEVGDGAAE